MDHRGTEKKKIMAAARPQKLHYGRCAASEASLCLYGDLTLAQYARKPPSTGKVMPVM
jgi:hypothetical protein